MSFIAQNGIEKRHFTEKLHSSLHLRLIPSSFLVVWWSKWEKHLRTASSSSYRIWELYTTMSNLFRYEKVAENRCDVQKDDWPKSNILIQEIFFLFFLFNIFGYFFFRNVQKISFSVTYVSQYVQFSWWDDMICECVCVCPM